jgi:hypothetical protein
LAHKINLWAVLKVMVVYPSAACEGNCPQLSVIAALSNSSKRRNHHPPLAMQPLDVLYIPSPIYNHKEQCQSRSSHQLPAAADDGSTFE